MNPKARTLTEQNLLLTGVDFASAEYMLEHVSMRSLSVGEKLLQPDIQSQHVYLILEGRLGIHLPEQVTLEHASLVRNRRINPAAKCEGLAGAPQLRA